jgi:hypothetical protein
LPLEEIDRALDAVPILLPGHTNKRVISLLADFPTFVHGFDRQSERLTVFYPLSG